MIRTISSRLRILMKVSLCFLEYKTSDHQTPFIFSPFLNLPVTYFIQLETICHPVVLKSFPVIFVLPFIFHTLRGRRQISCLNHFSLALPNYFCSFVFPCLMFVPSKCSVYCYHCICIILSWSLFYSGQGKTINNDKKNSRSVRR